MEKYSLRMIATSITASDTHCSNDCPHIQFNLTKSPSGAGAHCELFKCKLTWDKRKRLNGYKRLDRCIANEDLVGDAG